MNNKILLFSFAAIFIFIAFEGCKTLSKNNYIEDELQAKNYLAAYGKYVFEKESCKSCHTLNIDQRSDNLLSLDGFGNKYASDWLYYFLSDPKKFMIKPKMPSHLHLLDNLIDKSTFGKIIEEKGSKRQQKKIDRIWNKLLLQADNLSNEIPHKKQYDTSRTEVLALIAYLQQIPSSPSKITADSLVQAKQMEKEKVWDNFVMDENSIPLQVASKPESIAKGKLLYEAKCTACHGLHGEGSSGPNLTDEYWLIGGTAKDIAKTIVFGHAEEGMLSWRSQLNPTEVGELVAFIISIKGTNPENAKGPQGKKE